MALINPVPFDSIGSSSSFTRLRTLRRIIVSQNAQIPIDVFSTMAALPNCLFTLTISFYLSYSSVASDVTSALEFGIYANATNIAKNVTAGVLGGVKLFCGLGSDSICPACVHDSHGGQYNDDCSNMSLCIISICESATVIINSDIGGIGVCQLTQLKLTSCLTGDSRCTFLITYR